MSDPAVPVLSVRDLAVAFPTARAGSRAVVEGLSFDLYPGRVLALLGESGSGKSVTARSLLRLDADATVDGEVVLDGSDLMRLDRRDLRAVRGARIGTVFQEPMAAWNPVYPVGRQIREARAVHGASASDASIRGLLSEVGIDEPERIAAAFPHELSGGQLQRAMIAMAISNDPDVLLADEPTTALDVTTQAHALELLRRVARERQTAILLITHDMGVVAEIADEVVVLRDGAAVEAGATATVLRDPQHPYTRELLGAVPRVDGPGPPSPAASGDDVIASAREVTVRFGDRRRPVTAVDGISLDLRAGRTLGLVGESGSGKSTFARTLVGLQRVTSGSLVVEGHDIAAASSRVLRPLRRRVGVVLQDPSSALNAKRTVGWCVAEPMRLAGWGRARQADRVRELLERVRLDPDVAQRFPHQISGGQRQRVAIARALALEPSLVVADEPTSALDVSVQATVLALFADLQEQLGFAALFISHDLAVVRAIAHDVAVLRSGAILESGPTERVLGSPSHPYTRRLLEAVVKAPPPVRSLSA